MASQDRHIVFKRISVTVTGFRLLSESMDPSEDFLCLLLRDCDSSHMSETKYTLNMIKMNLIPVKKYFRFVFSKDFQLKVSCQIQLAFILFLGVLIKGKLTTIRVKESFCHLTLMTSWWLLKLTVLPSCYVLG